MARATTPKRDKVDEIGPPGAGTLFVYNRLQSEGSKKLSRSVEYDDREKEESWEDLCARHDDEEPFAGASPDTFLERGIAGYTYLPLGQGGILGKGKFSTVYKVLGPDGQYYALKHTPLYPHHPLIAARLLREPNLLAALPSHPCLIGVEGWIRTEGHFYLIEQYATTHIPLPDHPLSLTPSRAAYILDQLVSVLRDCLHSGGRVCHRDLKGENVLVDPETGDVLLLDLGLGTHFSASVPRLTTCCGSPAFHSPEIVHALNHPPGDITYYGPELDIWCIALTLLSLLLNVRFPLGPSHKSRYIMSQRVADRLQELDEVYPPQDPMRACRGSMILSAQEREVEREEWKRVRGAMRDFLEIDGIRRMRAFERYPLGPKIRKRCEEHDQGGGGGKDGRRFRSMTFIPGEIKYTLPLYLEPPPPNTTVSDAESSMVSITLQNPNGESERRINSYIRYLLRSKGILYHSLPNSSEILQLVVPISTSPDAIPVAPQAPRGNENDNIGTGWIAALNPFKARSASVPPLPKAKPDPKPVDNITESTGSDPAPPKQYLKVWVRITFEPSSTPASSRRSSVTAHHSNVAATISGQTRSISAASSSRNRIQPLSRAGSPVPEPRRPIVQRSATSRSRSRYNYTFRSASKVIITLSDRRGYKTVRDALDVRHLDDGASSAIPETPLGSPATALAGLHITRTDDQAEDEDEKNVRGESQQKDRGRPRSREDPGLTTSALIADTVIERKEGRDVSRTGRRGLWEGIFGRGVMMDPGRSASMPPAKPTPQPFD